MMELPAPALLMMLVLGAYHGINPGMGWLFAVALGMQEKSSAAVRRSLVPIALGHAFAIGAVVLLGVAVGAVLPLAYVRIGVAAILLGFGIYCLFRQRHPRGGGMRVGFGGLTLWSFLMASAHGAGFMVLPLLLGASVHAGHRHAAIASPPAALMATLVHTAGYLAVTGIIAWVVFEKVGLAILRKAWINLHVVWAIALIVSGIFTLLI